MSVCTKGIIEDIKKEDLIKKISAVTKDLQTSFRGKDKFSDESGYISFKYGGVLFQMYAYLERTHYTFEYHGENCVTDLMSKYTFLKKDTKKIWWFSLNYSEKSIEFMTLLTYIFNGWIDENDCDSEEYHKTELDERSRRKFITGIFK